MAPKRSTRFFNRHFRSRKASPVKSPLLGKAPILEISAPNDPEEWKKETPDDPTAPMLISQSESDEGEASLPAISLATYVGKTNKATYVGKTVSRVKLSGKTKIWDELEETSPDSKTKTLKANRLSSMQSKSMRKSITWDELEETSPDGKTITITKAGTSSKQSKSTSKRNIWDALEERAATIIKDKRKETSKTSSSDSSEVEATCKTDRKVPFLDDSSLDDSKEKAKGKWRANLQESRQDCSSDEFASNIDLRNLTVASSGYTPESTMCEGAEETILQMFGDFRQAPTRCASIGADLAQGRSVEMPAPPHLLVELLNILEIDELTSEVQSAVSCAMETIKTTEEKVREATQGVKCDKLEECD